MTLGTMHLGRLLVEFLRLHPELEVAVDLNDRYVDVAGGGYDLAVRVGRMEDSALIGRKLALIHRVVCASAAYLAESGTPRTVQDLQSHLCIGYANIGTSPLWQFDSAADDAGPTAIPMRCRFLVNNGDVMRDAAISGLGLIVLPTFIVGPALVSGALAPVKLDRRPTPAVLHAVYPATPHLPRAVRSLVDHLAKCIGDPPFWDAELAYALS
jgi:DNA-binding transcriptional LysR family regulator